MRRTVLVAVLLGALALAGLTTWVLSRHSDDPAAPAEITFRLDSFAINLFPPSLAEINSRRIGTLLHAPLIRLGESGAPTAALASSWSDEGLVWRFRMRPDARFSDGRPVTAADAAASICRSMQPGTSWAWSLNSIAHSRQGDRVRCDGLVVSGTELVVRQTFDAPWFEQAIAGPAGWVLPADANGRAAYGIVPGAGRYKIAAISPDSFVLLSSVDAGLPPIRFRYVSDDSQAAALLRNGTLSSLYLQTPLLRAAAGTGGANYRVTTRDFDRIRVLIINPRRLSGLGFSPDQERSFRDAYDVAVDRRRLEILSAGIAVADPRPLPIFGLSRRQAPPASTVDSLPKATLTVLSEPDSFSDQIAAALPRSVGPVQLNYRSMDKGTLISSLVSGDYDVVSMVLEGTMHSPKFWSSFFEPEGAFVAFGTPVPGVESIDFAAEDALRQLDTLIAKNGNWIVLVRERRIDAVSNFLAGSSYTPSGQDDLHNVRLQPRSSIQ